MNVLPEDELLAIRREYLDDMKRTAEVVRTHARALRDSKRFKTSFPVLLYTAHQIKGSGGTLGFPAISQIGSEMAASLSSFLDDSTERPSAQSLSESVGELSRRLDEALENASVEQTPVP